MVVAEDGRLARYMREVISPPVDVEEARVDIGILDCATVLKLRPNHHLACHAPLDTPALIFVGDREGLQLTGESRHKEIIGLGRCAAKEPVVLTLIEKGENFAKIGAAKSFCNQSTS